MQYRFRSNTVAVLEFARLEVASGTRLERNQFPLNLFSFHFSPRLFLGKRIPRGCMFKFKRWVPSKRGKSVKSILRVRVGKGGATFVPRSIVPCLFCSTTCASAKSKKKQSLSLHAVGQMPTLYFLLLGFTFERFEERNFTRWGHHDCNTHDGGWSVLTSNASQRYLEKNPSNAMLNKDY